MAQPLFKLNEFYAVKANVFHVYAEFYGNGYRGRNGQWVFPQVTLGIRQQGEVEEQAFYPAQSVSMRLTPQQCQELSAIFAKVARQLQGVK